MERAVDYIRLKTNILNHCVEDRLKYDPDIVELHLELPDLLEEAALRRTIVRLQEQGVKVYLHQPPKLEGTFWDLMTGDAAFYDQYMDVSRRLARICREERVRSVIHAHYAYSPEQPLHRITATNSQELRRRIEHVTEFAGDAFLWEDTIHGLFSYENPYLIDEVVKPLNLPLNVDVSHAFIALGGDNDKLRGVLQATRPYAQYYHLVDSMGVAHDSLPLGQGRIDWRMVAPLVADRDFIFEISLPDDHSDCTRMIESAAYFRGVLAEAGQIR
ncbi:sugar phosphate isomerase/epimerase family protein [Paenibacillus chartarius]|uniref:Sugar phosphate isomerase/epimerase family protein n=1 Tax=Paenibacillus chartarius TaxID=747481 RepID=A0ABV6DNK4_9BACL